MDPVTHTLAGVGLANAIFRRRIGPAAVPILAIASNLPDIDALVHLTGDPAALLYRRTFGHSLFVLPIWAILLAVTLRHFNPRLRIGVLFRMCLLGAAVHVFLDLVNSFGVALLWPFSERRSELAIIFIIDLMLTGLLAAPLLLGALRRLRPGLVWLSRVSLVAVTAYMVLCGAGRARAFRVLDAQPPARAGPPDFAYVFPEPLGPHRWRGVVLEDDVYRLYLIHPWSGRAEPRGTVGTSPRNPIVRQARSTHLGRRLERFFMAPVWTVRDAPPESGHPAKTPATVEVYDLRFRSLVLDRRDPVFGFAFHVHADGQVDEAPRLPGG